jgi:hypothetical protein
VIPSARCRALRPELALAAGLLGCTAIIGLDSVGYAPGTDGAAEAPDAAVPLSDGAAGDGSADRPDAQPDASPENRVTVRSLGFVSGSSVGGAGIHLTRARFSAAPATCSSAGACLRGAAWTMRAP